MKSLISFVVFFHVKSKFYHHETFETVYAK